MFTIVHNLLSHDNLHCLNTTRTQVFFIGGIKDLAKAVEEKRLHTFLQAEHKIYGPIVAYPGPAQLSVSVNDPELVREVFNQVRPLFIR